MKLRRDCDLYQEKKENYSKSIIKRNKENWDLPLAIKNLNTTIAQIIIEL